MKSRFRGCHPSFTIPVKFLGALTRTPAANDILLMTMAALTLVAVFLWPVKAVPVIREFQSATFFCLKVLMLLGVACSGTVTVMEIWKERKF